MVYECFEDMSHVLMKPNVMLDLKLNVILYYHRANQKHNMVIWKLGTIYHLQFLFAFIHSVNLVFLIFG
jgi:hypothetical protein